MSLRERDNVAVHNYLKQEKSGHLNKSVNVIDLMSRVEIERKREIMNTIRITTASLSALAFFAFIIILI